MDHDFSHVRESLKRRYRLLVFVLAVGFIQNFIHCVNKEKIQLVEYIQAVYRLGMKAPWFY